MKSIRSTTRLPRLLKFFLPAALVVSALLLWRYSRPPAPGASVARTGTTRPPPPSTDNAAAKLARALATTNPRERARTVGEQMQSWIARDPEAALAFVRQLPPGNERSQSLLMLLDTLGRTNPDRALALAAELVGTRDERSFYSSLFDRLARENISAAIPRLAAAPAGEAHDNALRALTDAWVRLDPAAARAWAETLPLSADRSLALEIIFLDLAPRDPLHAIELAQKSLAGPALDRVVLSALQTLTKTDPRGASELVSLLPPGELQTQAAMDVARAFGIQNPMAAVAWVKTLPAGNTQILALNNVLARWYVSDSGAAANFAGPQHGYQPGAVFGCSDAAGGGA